LLSTLFLLSLVAPQHLLTPPDSLNRTMFKHQDMRHGRRDFPDMMRHKNQTARRATSRHQILQAAANDASKKNHHR